MPIYKCEKCGKVHRTEDDVCCQPDQLAEPKPGGVSANGDGSLSCAPQATAGNKDKMKDGYRIEQMAPQPEELVGVVEPLDAEWVLVRNHDDEPMSIYGTREEAEAAVREANAVVSLSHPKGNHE